MSKQMTVAEVRKLLNYSLDDHNVLEGRIEELLNKLPQSGKDCCCGGQDMYDSILYGDFNEILRRCCNCGGEVEIRE